MENDESLVKSYYGRLLDSDNKVPILVGFFKEANEIENLPTNIYKTFARLYKIYGAELIFYSILDCTDMEIIDLSNISRLLSYFAKKRLIEDLNFESMTNLSKMAEKNLSSLYKKGRVKISTINFREAVND